MAVCLETGIISETELRSLAQADGLVKAISRETLAMYLVRAMQLEPLAKSLTSYPLSFARYHLHLCCATALCICALQLRYRRGQ